MSLTELTEIKKEPLGVESRHHVSRITYHSQEGEIKKSFLNLV